VPGQFNVTKCLSRQPWSEDSAPRFLRSKAHLRRQRTHVGLRLQDRLGWRKNVALPLREEKLQEKIVLMAYHSSVEVMLFVDVITSFRIV